VKTYYRTKIKRKLNTELIIKKCKPFLGRDKHLLRSQTRNIWLSIIWDGVVKNRQLSMRWLSVTYRYELIFL